MLLDISQYNMVEVDDTNGFLDRERRTLSKHPYVHIFIVGLVFAAFDTYAIGCNDMANAVSSCTCRPSLCDLLPSPHNLC